MLTTRCPSSLRWCWGVAPLHYSFGKTFKYKSFLKDRTRLRLLIWTVLHHRYFFNVNRVVQYKEKYDLAIVVIAAIRWIIVSRHCSFNIRKISVIAFPIWFKLFPVRGITRPPSVPESFHNIVGRPLQNLAVDIYHEMNVSILVFLSPNNSCTLCITGDRRFVRCS